MPAPIKACYLQVSVVNVCIKLFIVQKHTIGNLDILVKSIWHISMGHVEILINKGLYLSVGCRI